ncbi:hypothetical protein CPLU01_05807 [Colletotrichum plurivorum]|uniref:Uncharacterized protein n=1 Tax=Colletotrichum plurivorum TaxID=2175906 RepID=A0A8H6NHU9_9PEZI|nr:hypothetical protein CPLU01_05807 [Colletotrichum plurivorum]
MEGRWTLEYIVSGVLQLKEALHHIDVDINTIATSFNIIIIITTALMSSSSQLAPSWCDLHFSSDSIPNRNPDTTGETETDVSHLSSYSPTALIALITREARRATIQRRSTLIPAFSFPGLDDIRLDRTLLVYLTLHQKDTARHTTRHDATLISSRSNERGQDKVTALPRSIVRDASLLLVPGTCFASADMLRIATRWTTDPSVRNSLLSTSDLEPLGILHVHVLTTIPSFPTPIRHGNIRSACNEAKVDRGAALTRARVLFAAPLPHGTGGAAITTSRAVSGAAASEPQTPSWNSVVVCKAHGWTIGKSAIFAVASELRAFFLLPDQKRLGYAATLTRDPRSATPREPSDLASSSMRRPKDAQFGARRLVGPASLVIGCPS